MTDDALADYTLQIPDLAAVHRRLAQLDRERKLWKRMAKLLERHENGEDST